MLSATLETPTWASWLGRAAAHSGVSLDTSERLSWWRRDLLLVGPDAQILERLPHLDGVWLPMIVGVGEPKRAQDRVWCEAWLQEGDDHGLAILLPRAQRAGALRRGFRQGLAHDLRSPIGVISGYCELLSEELLGPLEPKQRSAVEKVYDQNQRLLDCLEAMAPALGAPAEVSDPSVRQV